MHQIIEIAGYNQLRLDRSLFCLGIPLYVRETLRFIAKKDIPVEDLELLCIELQPSNSKPFLVVAWYRPLMLQFAPFANVRVLLYLDKECKEILLMGDINCDLSQELVRLPSDSNSRNILNLYQLFCLKQLINEPTRVTLTTSTFIDHIATTCTDNILDSGVHKVSLSDDYKVFYKRKLKAVVDVGHKLIITRNMKKFNHEAFLADASCICLETIVNKSNDIKTKIGHPCFLL